VGTPSNNGGASNNGTGNNGTGNNGASNNGASNNGTSNNGSAEQNPGPGNIVLPQCDGSFDPCGGALNPGVYVFEDVCTNLGGAQLEGFLTLCPDLSAVATASVSGTLELSEDGTYTRDTSLRVRLHVWVPAACVQNSCIALEDNLNGECTQIGGTCDCVTDSEDEESQSGTWEIEGTSLFTNVDGNRTELPFCAVGDAVELQTFSSNDDSVEFRFHLRSQ
jgi:hypothetical protein